MLFKSKKAKKMKAEKEVELFKDKPISDELAQTLNNIQEKRTDIRSTIRLVSNDLSNLDIQFWDCVYAAHPEYKDYFVTVDPVKKTIHADLRK